MTLTEYLLTEQSSQRVTKEEENQRKGCREKKTKKKYERGREQ